MAALRDAVDWIARNEEPHQVDAAAVAGTLTCALVADLWGKERDEIARKVVRLRKQIAREETRTVSAREPVVRRIGRR